MAVKKPPAKVVEVAKVEDNKNEVIGEKLVTQKEFGVESNQVKVITE